MKYLVPADHFLVVLLQDLQDALIEVSLQRVIVFDAFLFHEGLDLRIAIPLLAFIFITADVHVLVRKQPGHFTQEHVEKLVCLIARGVERGLKDSCAALNLVRAGGAAELRVSYQPARAMAGNIKLGHNPNAAVARVSNDLAHLVLGVEETVRSERMKLGKLLALDAKALVF